MLASKFNFHSKKCPEHDDKDLHYRPGKFMAVCKPLGLNTLV